MAVFDLAFRGGGVKGIAYIGALKRLEADKHSMRRMIGASVGAIFATGVAAGYSASEMEHIVTQKNKEGKLPFADFMGTPMIDEDLVGARTGVLASVTRKLFLGGYKFDTEGVLKLGLDVLPALPIEKALVPVVERLVPRLSKVGPEHAAAVAKKVISLMQYGVVCSDVPLREWIAKKVLTNKDLGLRPEMTLKQFHEQISSKKNQQLSIVATDTSDQEALILNHLTAPSLPLIEAVRMSIGIPFIWKEVAWKEEWGTYGRRPNDVSKTGKMIVDGGVLSNFPLRFFLDPIYSDKNGLLGEPPTPANGVAEKDVRTAGLFFDQQSPNNAEEAPPSWYDELPIMGSSSRLLDTMLDTWDKDGLRQFGVKSKQVVCEIGTKGYDFLDFEMSKERIDALINRGECAMAAFLGKNK
jgi:predicted acylesterase/phospholipase RssA